jgi:YD repeat-containing protein
MNEPTDETLRRWLLRRLPAQEAETLEQRLLQDDAFGERLRDAETDLLDDLARGRLGDDERAQAAEYFAATPQDRARLRFAAALARVRGQGSAARRSADGDRHAARYDAFDRRVRWALRGRPALAAGLFASVCAIAIAVVGLHWRSGVAPGPAAIETTVTLMADRQRGAQAERVRIPADAVTIRLQIEVDAADAQARYTLSIDDARPDPFTVRGLVARQAGPYRFVEVGVDATTLADGPHSVRVILEGAPTPPALWSIETRRE